MANVYNNAKTLFMNSNTLDLDAGGDTYRVLLLKSSETYDPDDVYVSDLANEITGTTRQDLGGRVVAQDDTNDRADFSGNNVTFPTVPATQTIGSAVIYKFVTNDSDSILVAYFDLDDTAADGSNVQVRWDSGASSGDLIRLTE